MVAKITRYDLPASVKEANGVEFCHEENEYKININGVHMNIPSDAQMYSYVGTDITHISFPFADITLFDVISMPHITIYPEAFRGWVKE